MTDAELEATVQSDENVSKVDSDDDSVSLWYKSTFKLFGFIPMTANLKATADADGSVRVSRPWYSFLATSEASNAEEVAVKSEVTAVVQSYNTSADATFSAEAKTAIVRAMQRAFKTAAETRVSADASASGSVSY